jgi:3-amino-4-hydroxybenzoic acid synthase
VKFGWIDLRSVPPEAAEAVVDAAVHARLDGVVDDKPDVLKTMPPTIRRVYVQPAVETGAERPSGDPPDGEGAAATEADVVLRPVASADELAVLTRMGAKDGEMGAAIHVNDEPSLRLACSAAQELPYTLVTFRDPTKIPLEIVIAAADGSSGQIICSAGDVTEASVVLEVLEKGAEGVLLAPADAGDVFRLARLLQSRTPRLELSRLTVESISHDGLGDRVCVDTCTHLEKDEGILVGAYAHGFILCVSETHPLPYMPTRPFRVNAGALHSYVFGLDNRTNYLSELETGSPLLAVGADGRTRRVTVGRTKLESRPLLTIRAVSADGDRVSLTVQDDWHVRVLGPEAKVHNVTELRPGDELLGYLATDRRHVGWAVAEFCLEK